MQDSYVGDIGDFGKYGLLRFLSGPSQNPTSDQSLRLGVVWYLHPGEPDSSDGKFIDYLCDCPDNHRRFRDCDRPLYDSLRELVCEGKRNIAAIRRSGVLPRDTAFYERSLPYTPGASRPSRQAAREDWIEGALGATAGSNVVFFDPDNGISETARRFSKRGLKYVFIEELRRFSERGQSLVIYHHLGRRGKAAEQIRYFARGLHSNLGLSRLPWSLWYHRRTPRAYFIAAQEQHESILEDRLECFLKSGWSAHFSRGDRQPSV